MVIVHMCEYTSCITAWGEDDYVSVKFSSLSAITVSFSLISHLLAVNESCESTSDANRLWKQMYFSLLHLFPFNNEVRLM